MTDALFWSQTDDGDVGDDDGRLRSTPLFPLPYLLVPAITRCQSRWWNNEHRNKSTIVVLYPVVLYLLYFVATPTIAHSITFFSSDDYTRLYHGPAGCRTVVAGAPTPTTGEITIRMWDVRLVVRKERGKEKKKKKAARRRRRLGPRLKKEGHAWIDYWCR